MGLKIGISGAGQFSPSFIPIFQAHPAGEEVVLPDIVPERRAGFAELFGIKRTFAAHGYELPGRFHLDRHQAHGRSMAVG